MSRTWVLVALLLAVGLGTGCSQKAPARKAVDQAEQALFAVNEQAQKYFPERYSEVKAELDEARRALEDGHYADAIKAAQEIPPKAKALGEAATIQASRLAEKVKPDWDALAASVPDMLAALDARIKELGNAATLPPEVKPEALAEAPKWSEFAQREWKEAQSEHDQGNLDRALEKARGAGRMAEALLRSLGLQQEQVKPAG
jgi:hypothetical protein